MADTEAKLREILFDLEAATDSSQPEELIRSAAKKVREMLAPEDPRPHP